MPNFTRGRNNPTGLRPRFGSAVSPGNLKDVKRSGIVIPQKVFTRRLSNRRPGMNPAVRIGKAVQADGANAVAMVKEKKSIWPLVLSAMAVGLAVFALIKSK